ncbi:MAG: class I SAM-dependent methyltransferase [Micromonosporaceae bacterium]|nr:class I SAM-dependent methyltransferase [Micromonosporaceae bacterium]
MTDEKQRLSFGAAAQEYDARRPSYPEDAVAWAVGDAPARVVDLGAGTGILTRVLLALGHTVLPVEPDPEMRRRLAQRSPGVEPLAGSAEAIPLPDGSVDAVVAGQAYHWFEKEKAHREIGRVVRPGGVFAPIWNIRDESVPWVARLSEILDDRQSADQAHRRHEGDLTEPDFGPLFGPVQRAVFRHCVPLRADGLRALVATRSYYITATPQRRAEVDAGIHELTAQLPETFELPYQTIVYRAYRRH